MFFISPAFADDAATAATSTAGEPSMLMSAAPLLFIFVMFYFLLIRPQQRKIKDHDTMIKALRRGDKIVTGGGVIGVIQKLEAEDVLVVEVAPDVRIRILRDTVSTVLTKTVANDNQADDKSADVK